MLGWRLANRIHDRRRMGVPDRRSARTDDPGRQ
jgi:hypothetical protein